ncbi:MAG TPA: glycoside hydrolase family 38 C-terminal domain-containing protein [Pseudolysinimonas sp.]|jgi:alpha-mannosidase
MSFATFLFGLRAEQPLEYRRVRRIRQKIYTKVAPLKAEVLPSTEPIPFAELDRSAFEPIRNGGVFGKTLDCAWLRVTGEVPAGVEKPVVLLGIRGEGLVYSPDGELVDAVTTVFLQGDLPHSGGNYRPVSHLATAPGPIEFFADVSYNGYLLYPVGRGVFHGAWIATRDEEAFGLYYDYLTLLVLAGATEDAALEARLRAGLRAAYARFSAGDIPAARAALAGLLGTPSEPGTELGDFEYSAIGHGHLDQAWLWPIRETKRKAARTYLRQVAQTADYPGYLYGTSQPQQLLWTKQEHPALYERVKTAVAAGRIELQGSFWVETDTNLPGGESLVRQSLVGRRFLAEEFGLTPDDMRLCWLPDTFGYSGNLPQILKKSGMDWFQTIKLAWNTITVFPHRTFTWEGIDGSSVLVHMPPEGDYNSRAAADGLLKGLAQYPEKALETALLVFGGGDGGGGPSEVHLELLEREHDLHGLPRVAFSTASDFFRRLEKLPIEVRHRGELYLETHQGTYTTQARIKRGNRIAERKLHEAEALAAIVGDDSGPVLEQHWRDLLLHHFHDILPGSSITRVNTEAVATLDRITASVDDYIAGLIARLPREGDAPAALNLTSMTRREHVAVDGRWYSAEAAPYSTAALEPVGDLPELSSGADTLSNGLVTVRFGSSGEIVSFLDANGAEHSAGGLNRLVLHRDPYQFPFDAWNIGIGYLKRRPRTLRPSTVETFVDGPRVIRRQVYRWARGTIDQRVILEAGSELVRFDTTIDWHEKHRMLRTEFRPVHYGDTVTCEIQFGHIERTALERTDVERAQFEICAHKWVAVQDDGGGFALLNDSKFGHRAKSRLLSLNLLRSPTFPDKTADRGIHQTSYAIRPFATGDLASVVRDGYRLNNPVTVVAGAKLASVASTDHPAVIVETIKPAENGNGVILRLYESLGAPARASLRTELPGVDRSTACETDLMEVPLGPIDLDRLEFTPFEIKTILLEPEKEEAVR